MVMADSLDVEPSELGIVIPTYGRVDLLRQLLVSLCADMDDFDRPPDVVVVDDSPEDEARQIAELCTEYKIRYAFKQGNVSQKRNLGAELVNGDVILFLDSDCEARPGLLKGHWRAYSDLQVVACLGLVTFVGGDNWLTRIIEESPLLVPFSSPLTHKAVTWGPSANFSARRSAFEQVGGFDETRSPPGTGGEDVDLGLRLSSQVGSIVTAPNAEVWHSKSTWSSLSDNVRRFLSWGRGDCLLIRNHPELSFWDMPSLMVTSILVFVVSVLIAAIQRQLWPLFGSLFFPVASSLIFGWLHPVKDASIARRFYRGGTLLLMTILDIGRLLEAVKLRRPLMAMRRFRFAQDQLFEEWDDLVSTGWALLIAICLTGVLFW
jgi:GT2 family glycosyltransferase